MNCTANECAVCHPQVCTEGRLILEFTFDDLMRIKTWHFTIRQYRELVPRSILAMHVSNDLFSSYSLCFLFNKETQFCLNKVPLLLHLRQGVLSIQSSPQSFECISSFLLFLFPSMWEVFHTLGSFPWWMVSIFFSCSNPVADTFLFGCMNLLPVMRMWTKTGSGCNFQFWSNHLIRSAAPILWIYWFFLAVRLWHLAGMGTGGMQRNQTSGAWCIHGPEKSKENKITAGSIYRTY